MNTQLLQIDEKLESEIRIFFLSFTIDVSNSVADFPRKTEKCKKMLKNLRKCAISI